MWNCWFSFNQVQWLLINSGLQILRIMISIFLLMDKVSHYFSDFSFLLCLLFYLASFRKKKIDTKKFVSLSCTIFKFCLTSFSEINLFCFWKYCWHIQLFLNVKVIILTALKTVEDCRMIFSFWYFRKI